MILKVHDRNGERSNMFKRIVFKGTEKTNMYNAN